MENCITESLLFQYLVNELSSEQNELIKEHLSQCASCQKRIEIYSDDDDLKKWKECHQRQTTGEISQSQPFSEERLDKLFNSTVSSIQESKAQTSQNGNLSDSRTDSQFNENISIGKELNLNPIKTIGQYHLIKKIGQGGMGTVYLAVHTHLKKKSLSNC